ncbi:hypothetical protein Tco_0924166 [Tanacetum coccineum]|uniref:Transposase (putative) gypsy type domain-containing protein n=1 Tax=Tanacetum coccineum TaxID=301880 RepID=A0ABQ5D451_9ASTR
MGSITDIKSVLSQKNLDIFCKNFHIPDEVHPLLPSRNQTIHEMPTGKIGVYTRFFEFANFRLPLSTFLVDVLRYYRIHISQLSVIAAAKVSHFEIMCRVHDCEPTVGLFRCFYVNSKNKGWMSFSKRPGHDAVCYTKPLDSLKGWNDHFFWVDAFACPASFSWHTSKSVSKDPFTQSTEFNAEHYASLVAYPAPFHKYLEPFLCLVGISYYSTLDQNTYPEFLYENGEEMNLLSFIHTADPMKVRIGERQRGKDEPKLLDTTVGRVVLLLLVAPARASSELEASVDKLFEEGGSGSHAEQGDSVSGGHDVGIPQVSETTMVFTEDAAPLQLRRQRKRKTVRLLAGAVLNPKVGVVALPTLPFITSSVFVTLEREDGAELYLLPGLPYLLLTMMTTVTSTVDPTTTTKEKFIESSIFGGGSSSGAEHTVGSFSGLTGSDFIVGGIRTVVSPDTDLLKAYIPQWSVTNGSCLDDGRTCREMVDEFAPPKFFASIHGMEHDELFIEFNVGAARQMSLSTEVRMRCEFNIREKRRLSAVVEEKNSLLKARDVEVASFKAQLLVKEAEDTEAIRLRAEVQTLADRNTVLEGEKSDLDVKVADLAPTVNVREQEVADLDAVVASVKLHNDNLSDQVHTLEVSSAGFQEKVTAYENFIGQLEKFQDDQIREMNEKSDKLDNDLVELALHLEEKFYPHLLTTISGRRWLLTYGLELAIAKCLNSTEYLSALGTTISKAIEKGMQEGLSTGITHGATDGVLTDVAAYNPSTEADYLSASQRLQSVNFSLITELNSNKDASVDTIMNLLHLENSLAERLGLTESQPHVDQLMVPIHHSSDRRVIGASALSLSLDVSSSRVQRIKENIANHRSALRDVFVPFSEPLSATALMGTKVISATTDTPTALSTTLASASTITPISIEDYEVAGTDGWEAVNKSVPNNVPVGMLIPFPMLMM